MINQSDCREACVRLFSRSWRGLLTALMFATPFGLCAALALAVPATPRERIVFYRWVQAELVAVIAIEDRIADRCGRAIATMAKSSFAGIGKRRRSQIFVSVKSVDDGALAESEADIVLYVGERQARAALEQRLARLGRRFPQSHVGFQYRPYAGFPLPRAPESSVREITAFSKFVLHDRIIDSALVYQPYASPLAYPHAGPLPPPPGSPRCQQFALPLESIVARLTVYR